MFINVHKCLYKFGLGDINMWMLDSRNVWMLDRRLVCYVGVLSWENKLSSHISEPCLMTGLFSLHISAC